ncbi:PAS/PAC sensor signal transduction histidine kinase [Hymenobacter roseosalivarius DSM 11622]|uniref:histidine kinase n=1 Tax=Hymenobacter roseosalivarius DSM 11622 TaxID=645990 RepID=A0A1W1W242_9BACT|nr:PAS domain-containing sensor histidine kinase [Hymenobacter roseosalivarius]SMB99677.1 PAS/PAC sensor signal transduction histidine kinase [Hymenobacter roseosalivarius DSM 11622]
MSDAPIPPPISTSSEAANHVLRAENSELRADQAAATAQEAEQERYQQSQARFRTVFENSPLGQKIITPDLTIRQANPAVVAMLGCGQLEDLVGHKIIEFAHPAHRADWQELQTRLWEHKLPSFALETCLVRCDGSSFWCQVTSVLFPDEGGELGYTILEDISARKGMEAKLQRLYDAQETILQLATHDMKAPIAQIELLVDLLQREVSGRAGDGPPPPEMVHYLGLIQRACTHATGLLEDVLYVGDLDAHGLDKRPTDLSAYLATRLEGHRLAAQHKGVALVLDLPVEPVHGRLHPDKFGRVLDNLVGNALKFTPAGGTVTLGARLHEGKVHLTVQDTGIGIPGKLHNQLFDKFNPTRRTGLYGEATTGLGLFIAKQIVQLHGGDIWLESREQEGTTFFVELP